MPWDKKKLMDVFDWLTVARQQRLELAVDMACMELNKFSIHNLWGHMHVDYEYYDAE